MFEALESRQLFSVAITSAATEPTADTSYQTGGSAYSGGILVGLGDGSVRFVQASIGDAGASNQTILVVHTRSG